VVQRLPEPEAPVTAISGMRADRARLLAKLGIRTVADLLRYTPRAYQDLSRITPVAELRIGEVQTVRVTVQSVRRRVTYRKAMHIVEMDAADASGAVSAVWFNQPYMADKMHPGDRLFLAGRVDLDHGRALFNSPSWDRDTFGPAGASNTARLVPVYPETSGITSRMLRTYIRPLLPLADRLPDVLPADARARQDLLPLDRAIRQAHFPDSGELAEAAGRRLQFDEAFVLQLLMAREKRRLKSEPGTQIPFDEEAARAFVASLPFALTQAQRRAAWEILRDMDSPRPMNRMLEGDVGSGKTVVAAFCCHMAARAGFQSVLMAPTEILARQHHRTMSALLEPHGWQVELAVGSARVRERRRLRESMAGGLSHIAVGTHALIQEDIEFVRLGLAIVDEQHRFGVGQRKLLREKGHGAPDFLSMTATPIPRTMHLVLFGDLDLSVLDELPPGRPPVRTRVVRPDERRATFEQISARLRQGRQAFIICPLIEVSERLEARAATREYEALAQGELREHRLGLLHGRMRAADKDSVMNAFAAGELDALVSTTVVEVGVDVPNATVMAVLNAERFGLAQLHQLRGRVGRGAHESECLLFTELEEHVQRLALMASTNDGFRLAELDLKLRGPGQAYGARQHGHSNVLGSTLVDAELVRRARQEVDLLLERDPDLTHHTVLAAVVAERSSEIAPD
jgi:ATP-dependent DNA helicase RecG